MRPFDGLSAARAPVGALSVFVASENRLGGWCFRVRGHAAAPVDSVLFVSASVFLGTVRVAPAVSPVIYSLP